jgi:hypothetical protein
LLVQKPGEFAPCPASHGDASNVGWIKNHEHLQEQAGIDSDEACEDGHARVHAINGRRMDFAWLWTLHLLPSPSFDTVCSVSFSFSFSFGGSVRRK